MTRRLVILFLLSLFMSRLPAATLDELLPWLAPNSLALGVEFSEFTKERESATEIFPAERRSGGPFNGVMVEGFSDGTSMLYSFVNNELAAIDVTSNPGSKMTEALLSMRTTLNRIHGEPGAEYSARVDGQGSIAKIITEVYRPSIDKNSVLRLRATSTGIEINVADEGVYRKHGQSSSRESYEEAVRSVSSVVKPNEKPSELVDYLAAAREKDGIPPPNASSAPTSTPVNQPSPSPTGQESSAAPKPTPQPRAESAGLSVVLLVILGALIAVAVVFLLRRKFP